MRIFNLGVFALQKLQTIITTASRSGGKGEK
jgi:hypothetical protein